MPKQPVPPHTRRPSVSALPGRASQSKMDRSHEENQERAYIAASRRTDRSLEARVQSARMASEIHLRRTGKRFRISEEIVMREEMYEEEEDDFPRSYRLLGPHMQTGSAAMNDRVEAYLSNRVIMSQLVARGNEAWRENAINRLFALSFPNADAQFQRMNQQLPLSPSFGPAAQSLPPSSPPPARERPHVATNRQDDTQSASPRTAPPSPVDPHLRLPSTPHGPSNLGFFATLPAGSGDAEPADYSPFTSELPAEATLLMAGRMADEHPDLGPLANPQTWPDPAVLYGGEDPSLPVKPAQANLDTQWHSPTPYVPDETPPVDWEGTDPSTIPAIQMEEPAWDSFLDESAWGSEQ